MAINLYDITEWIVAEYYFVSWNDLPYTGALFSPAAPTTQTLNFGICYANMRKSRFPIFKVLLTPLCFWLNIQRFQILPDYLNLAKPLAFSLSLDHEYLLMLCLLENHQLQILLVLLP